MMTEIVPIRTVAPTVQPVSVLDAKRHLRVTASDEDLLIAALIEAAVSQLDGWSGILGRCICTQTWRQDFEEFEDDELKLPFPDVQSVTVQYYDADNVLQTFSSANYYLINTVSGAEIELAANASWPATYYRPDAIRVTMVCGYGAAADVPASIKAAILLHVGHLFENREAVGPGALAELPLAYAALTGPHRRVGL